MAKKQVKLGPGRTAVGESIKFKPVQEPWYEFELEDGSRLRLKVVVAEILRLEDMYSQEGEPVYVVKSSNLLHADVPDELKRDATPPSGKTIQ